MSSETPDTNETSNESAYQQAMDQYRKQHSPLEPLLQWAQSLAKPIQSVFSLRNHTQMAKIRVKELQDRVARLEAEIDAASGNNDTGHNFDRYR